MYFYTFVFEIDHDENHSNNAFSSRLEVDFGKPSHPEWCNGEPIVDLSLCDVVIFDDIQTC